MSLIWGRFIYGLHNESLSRYILSNNEYLIGEDLGGRCRGKIQDTIYGPVDCIRVTNGEYEPGTLTTCLPYSAELLDSTLSQSLTTAVSHLTLVSVTAINWKHGKQQNPNIT
jgi:hypothetical protein